MSTLSTSRGTVSTLSTSRGAVRQHREYLAGVFPKLAGPLELVVSTVSACALLAFNERDRWTVRPSPTQPKPKPTRD